MQTFDLAPIAGRTLYWSVGILGTVAVVALLSFIGLALAMQRPTIVIGADALRIDSRLFGRVVPLAQIDRAGAKRIDLATPSDLQPTWRTMGIGLPGYRAGWFSLANGSKALLFVTGDRDAVYVPTTQDYALILTPADPEAFLAALKSAGR